MSSVPALIPAAGQGTRLRPVTSYLSKPMLPVGAKPVIHFALDEARNAGCDPVIVIRSSDDNRLREFLDKYHGDRVRQAVQERPRGLADALLKGFKTLGEKRRCAVVIPDNVILDGTGIASLIEADVSENVLGTTMVDREEAQYFGNSGGYEGEPVPGEESLERIRELRVKGEGSFRRCHDNWPVRRSVARNLLTPEFFERTERRSPDPETGEIDDVPILRAMVKSSTVYGCPIDGDVYDMGTPERYTRLNCAIHQRLHST